jgi:hypothetical protein
VNFMMNVPLVTADNDQLIGGLVAEGREQVEVNNNVDEPPSSGRGGGRVLRGGNRGNTLEAPQVEAALRHGIGDDGNTHRDVTSPHETRREADQGSAEIRRPNEVSASRSTGVPFEGLVRRGGDGDGNNPRQMLKQLFQRKLIGTTSLLAFCLLFLFVWSWYAAVYVRPAFDNADVNSYNTWVSCIQAHFDGESDASWISVCGEQARYYAEEFQTYLISLFLMSGQSIMVGAIFITQFLDVCRGTSMMRVNREIARLKEIERSLANMR